MFWSGYEKEIHESRILLRMKKIRLVVISICLISVLVGCGSLTSKEEPRQSIADMEFQELSKGSDSTGQPEVQGSMETEEFVPADRSLTELFINHS